MPAGAAPGLYFAGSGILPVFTNNRFSSNDTDLILRGKSIGNRNQSDLSGLDNNSFAKVILLSPWNLTASSQFTIPSTASLYTRQNGASYPTITNRIGKGRCAIDGELLPQSKNSFIGGTTIISKSTTFPSGSTLVASGAGTLSIGSPITLTIASGAAFKADAGETIKFGTNAKLTVNGSLKKLGHVFSAKLIHVLRRHARAG